MNEKEILQFKADVCNLSLAELYNLQIELNEELGKMILDTELVLKAAVVDLMIKEKKEEKMR